MTSAEIAGEAALPEGARVYTTGDLQSQGAANEKQPLEYRGRTYLPGSNSHWKASWPEGMERLGLADRIHVSQNSIRYVRYADDFGHQTYTNLWTDTGTGQFTDPKVFVVQTNTKLVARCMSLSKCIFAVCGIVPLRLWFGHRLITALSASCAGEAHPLLLG